LIVMSISDTIGDDLDGEADGMWAALNPTDDDVSFTVADLIGEDVVLHPVLAESVDPVVQSSSFDDVSGEFFVPVRTTAAFVQLEPDTTPPEGSSDAAGACWSRTVRCKAMRGCDPPDHARRSDSEIREGAALAALGVGLEA
jgi:hypothetical protein